MIPLSIPNISEIEQAAVARALESGWVSTAGPDIGDFERKLAAMSGVPHCVAVNSGSAALHLALLAMGVQPGDFVICPNLTFVATANAIRLAGGEPLLIDSAADNLQMDLDLLEAFLRDKTELRNGKCVVAENGRVLRAIVIVHVLADFCDIDRLLAIAAAHGVPVLEDAAAALGAQYKERPAGSMGLMGTLSFNGNKILTTGGGGAILTHDRRLADHVRHLAAQAKSFPVEYIHDAVGYNYGLPNLSAALGLGQLLRFEEFWNRKQAIRRAYEEAFEEVEGLRLVPRSSDENAVGYWLNCVFTEQARPLESYLEMHDIQTRKLWVPMKRLPMYGNCFYVSDHDHSHRWYEESLCLPSSTGLTDEDLHRVIAAVRQFFS
ncbi:MAG: aminotransferase class I/II-fold pyridoxal phosphate-dependent enzyme [Bacteroidia bacterium]